MRKERKEVLGAYSTAPKKEDIERCLLDKGFTDIEILSVKKEYGDTGHCAQLFVIVEFLANKIGEDIAEKFRLLCESLDSEGQNEMGELEYQLADDFDRCDVPVYTEELYTRVVGELQKRGKL